MSHRKWKCVRMYWSTSGDGLRNSWTRVQRKAAHESTHRIVTLEITTLYSTQMTHNSVGDANDKDKMEIRQIMIVILSYCRF